MAGVHTDGHPGQPPGFCLFDGRDIGKRGLHICFLHQFLAFGGFDGDRDIVAGIGGGQVNGAGKDAVLGFQFHVPLFQGIGPVNHSGVISVRGESDINRVILRDKGEIPDHGGRCHGDEQDRQEHGQNGSESETAHMRTPFGKELSGPGIS